MIESLLKAMLGISAILGGWLWVQWLWARTTAAAPGRDAMAGRLGCHGCDCRSFCEADNEQTPGT